ncbi:hypothetical protein GV64_15380 [Endozoicomonas elysicola]|uniref:Uncharacterized protein n=1 Tax=Endozoicomonas elysicola TaxID=305900 RepID=A0A081KCQ2_9GAMM|nr:hypothetical protein GV64_15380 [Endozoicomonas elysicola]
MSAVGVIPLSLKPTCGMHASCHFFDVFFHFNIYCWLRVSKKLFFWALQGAFAGEGRMVKVSSTFIA